MGSEECQSHQRQHLPQANHCRKPPSGRIPSRRSGSIPNKGHASPQCHSGQPAARASSSTPRSSSPLAMASGFPSIEVADQPKTAEEIIQEIDGELKLLEVAALRKRLRSLQLQWHPDRAWRHNIDSGLSCQVFNFVQSTWEALILAPAPMTTVATDGEMESPAA